VAGGFSGKEGFCYRYLVEFMSVDKIEIFGCLIETRDRYSELPFEPST
jgi:hypothetical protein